MEEVGNINGIKAKVGNDNQGHRGQGPQHPWWGSKPSPKAWRGVQAP